MMQEENPVSKDEELQPSESRRIIKNVLVLAIAFMVQSTAYSGAANLQSSINAKAGLGTASLAAVCAGLIFSNLFLPVVFIKWLGTKWTISLMLLSDIPYIAAQFKPTFYTMIPAGLIVGLAGGPLWCAKYAYVCVVSEAQRKISKTSAEVPLTRFLGLFLMIYHFKQIWGNLISSLVLRSGHNAAAVTSLNASLIPELCGANFLPNAIAKKALPPQPPEKIHMLAGIYLSCMVVASLIVAVGLDSLSRYDRGRKSQASLKGLALLSVTLKLLMDRNQQLLIILCAFLGYQEAFVAADFTAAFISCAVGTGSVGFVMMAFGAANAVGSVTAGYLSKVTGRLPLMCGALVLNTVLLIVILTWRPQPGLGYVLYVIAVMWGLCDSVFVVLINAYFGILFPGREEAAYAVNHFWKSGGRIAAYVLSPHLHTSSKTYLMMAMMLAGFAGYLVVEVRDRRFKRCLETTKEVTQKNTSGCDNVGFENNQ